MLEPVLDRKALNVDHLPRSGEDGRNITPAIGAQEATPQQDDGLALPEHSRLQPKARLGLRPCLGAGDDGRGQQETSANQSHVIHLESPLYFLSVGGSVSAAAG